MTKRSYEGLI